VANEIQKYTFSAVPNGGSWKPVYDSNPSSGSMNDVNAGAELAAYLAQITGIDNSANVSCGGNYTSGMTVEFVGSLANTDMLELSYQDNTLTMTGSATFGTTQDGGGGNNEVQTIILDSDGGTFTILIPGYGTTGTLNWNDDANTISLAITSAVGSGAMVVGSGASGSYSFEFQGGLANSDIPQMSFGANSLTKSVSISVSVLQEGSATRGSPQSPLNLLLLGVG